jgi:hypothetical protein
MLSGTAVCHVYGRGKSNAQMIPGWPCSFVAALETGRTSWTALLDAQRLGPADDMARTVGGGASAARAVGVDRREAEHMVAAKPA